LLPLIIFGFLTFNSIKSIGDKIVDDAFLMVDLKTQKTLEVQASNVAKSVEKFLRSCENDILTLSNTDFKSANLLAFHKSIRREVWSRKKEANKIISTREYLPIYKEVSYIDLNGQEIIKIKDSRIAPRKELKNVGDPKNTTYKSENYFKKSVSLKKGEIYLSHLTGFYVTPSEQLGEETEIENAVEGETYDGVFRLTTPVYRNDIKIGLLVVGIDHAHMMEFTQHILPNSEEETVFPSYDSGDYAFMFDDEGWIITHPKYWDIRGVDSTGKMVPPYSENTPKSRVEKGEIPFNLKYAGFIHENYPVVADKILHGEIGSVITTNIGGIKKKTISKLF